ncbi:LA2681 family HEPN domain-containing protein [Alcaligenes aquatilis]|uniref:LA2681 family HEPN domain-containing protein n=1 Tax=Alcaligenes aquatilis TaxID=323284 RepID=UPI002AA67A38|nr:LA2681 family HEPN domain-containing protein [Alcaligenes faecalis]
MEEQHVSSKAPFDGTPEALAVLIDSAIDKGNQAELCKAIKFADEVESKCGPLDACLVCYYRSNAWAALHQLRTKVTNPWCWELPELQNQIYWLRRAIRHEGYSQLPPSRRAQFHCNLGNLLNTVGRFVEALDEWEYALREQPILGIARGNLGRGLVDYGSYLSDPGNQYLFLHRGAQELERAIVGGADRDGSTYPEAITEFESWLRKVKEMLGDAIKDEPSPVFLLGRSRREREYRQWSLDKKLFLNPLNDLGVEYEAACDVLILPPHNIGKHGITLLAFFNQLKQEYAYARWCLYEGSHIRSVHFSDREVVLAFNADMALYSMGIEKIKTAFRCAYSLLDKIAYFVSDYWQLEISEKQVNFRDVWFENPRAPEKQLHKKFESSRNQPLRGLFWLSKDIYSKNHAVMHPSARELDSLRNHLEHKYVKVVYALSSMAGECDIFTDNLAHQIQQDELVRKTEYLLRQSRSALIYLCLAMDYEESQMRAGNDGVIALMEYETYPDTQKVVY